MTLGHWAILCAATMYLSTVAAADTIRVIDKEVRYGAVSYPSSDAPRPAPIPQTILPTLAPIPSKIKGPYAWEENFYAGPADQCVYMEPGKPWAFRLFESTRGIDDTTEGALDYKVWYSVTNDRGKTWTEPKPVVQRGAGYDPMHPIRGVYVNKNGYVFAGRIVRASNGHVLVPIYHWPLGSDGKAMNPYKTTTFMESGVLIGRWTEGGRDILWDAGDSVRPGLDESTRGTDECHIVELSRKGHFLMVARGSNANRSTWPGRKWYTVSKDGCRTWSQMKPWTYSDGLPFYSPASHGYLIRSKKNKRIYWIGNLVPENPDGNTPRYPLVIGEVDEKSLGLIRETVTTIDTRNPQHDSAEIQLSNFTVYEMPDNGNLLITLKRWDKAPGIDKWHTPPCWYLVELPAK